MKLIAGWQAPRRAIARRPWPKILRPIVGYAATTRINTIIVTDPTGVGAAQRMGAIALPCYATGQGLAPSHTSALSMLHLLAASTAGRGTINSPEIPACDEAGIAVGLPKPMTSAGRIDPMRGVIIVEIRY